MSFGWRSIRLAMNPAFVPVRSMYGVLITATGTPEILSVRTMSSAFASTIARL